jgi:haloacetate dehalogenase
MINAVGAEWFLTNRGGIPKHGPKIVMDEFIRCFTPKTVSGACRDYRAGATIISRWMAADKDRPITTPLLVLWERAASRRRMNIPPSGANSAQSGGHPALPSGHYIQEEQPDRFTITASGSFTA